MCLELTRKIASNYPKTERLITHVKYSTTKVLSIGKRNTRGMSIIKEVNCSYNLNLNLGRTNLSEIESRVDLIMDEYAVDIG